jgi:hypothetical protein
MSFPLAFQLPGNLTVEQASLFLLRDGTLLSFFQSEGERVTGPLLDRLKVRLLQYSATDYTAGVRPTSM